MGLINKLDKDYTDLLQDILDNGNTKSDRTGTGTISVFGRQIRHNMKDGFPLLTTKKMPFKTIVTELLWFLRGDTNIKYLVDNNCHIWDGDAYKNYVKTSEPTLDGKYLSQPEFIHWIKTDDEFAKKWGELGPIYGKQWRNWDVKPTTNSETGEIFIGNMWIDQIQNLINDLKGNPDSRRLMVNAWNVAEIEQMTLPPCHYGFQVYTRELSYDERNLLYAKRFGETVEEADAKWELNTTNTFTDDLNIAGTPTRAISLMWNQRSVDTFLGLPFNIASYGLLLEIIAKSVNMVPDELIGNLGDVHLYSNHIEQAKEQIGRHFTPKERTELLKQAMGEEAFQIAFDQQVPFGGGLSEYFGKYRIAPNLHTRTPYQLPTLNINTEFWPTQGGSCGEGPLDATAIFEGFKNDDFCRCLLEEDIQLSNYKSHPPIKAPLSN